MKLTAEQIEEITAEMVPSLLGTPVRFLIDGQNIASLSTGDLSPKGINVMHQMVYWNFTRETSNKIAGWLGAKAVFSE